MDLLNAGGVLALTKCRQDREARLRYPKAGGFQPIRRKNNRRNGAPDGPSVA
jgi:hypothetical protein